MAYMDTGITIANHMAIGSKDIVFAKYDTAGNYLWSKSIGGPMEDLSTSIEMDTLGSIYVSGWFEDTMDFAVGIGEYKIASNGDKDIFMAKYDQRANFIWAHGFGDVDTDRALNIDADDNTLYLTGYFKNLTDFDPDTSFSTMSTSSPNGSAFLAKYSICYDNHSFDTLKYCPNSVAAYGPYYSFSEPGDHHIRLVNPMGCDSLITLHVESNDPVDTQVLQNGHILRVNDTTATIQWIDCAADTIIPGADSVVFIASSIGNYAALITDSTTSCTDTSSCFNILSVGLETVQNEMETKMYPNPTSQTLYLETQVATTIELLDRQGRLIDQFQLKHGLNKLDVSDLRAGLYLVKVLETNKFKKLIIQE